MTELCNMALNIILSRLPPKSLVRFKRVHKSWQNMINNPHFVTTHLSNSTRASSSLFFKRSVLKNTETDDRETLLTLVSNSYDNASHSFVADDIAMEQCIGFEDLKSVTLHGHADGIICLADSDNNMVLCNPATRKFKKCASPDPGVGALGFGSDPKTRDFKVVNITENGESDNNDGNDEHLLCNPPTIKLYTLSTHSWTEINTDTLETETTYILPGCLQMLYYKGFCYWAGNEQLKEFISVFDMTENQTVRQLIVSFDVVD